MNTGLDLEGIKAELNYAEPYREDDNLVRRVFLGTVFALCPSGKYYTPWANSNVAGDCAYCHGTGQLKNDKPCPRCDGMGSRSAALDERWYALAETELESIGACLESGEGDPCDLFAARYENVSDEASVDKLMSACRDLIAYRDRAGAQNFQLEKADDFINAMRAALDEIE